MRKILLLIIFILLYGVILYWRYKSVSNTSFDINNEYIEGVILEEPAASMNRQSFTVNGVRVITKRYPEFQYGDYIKFEIRKSKLETNPKSKTQNIIINYPQIELIDKSKGNQVLREIYNFREEVVDLYQRVLPGQEAGLLAGIVLGVKTSLPYDFNEALKKTGTMHVVVASGMNITFIAKFLFLTLSLFLNRRLAVAFSMFGVLFYMALAGFQPPIVRAGLMGIVAFSAQIIGRQNWGAYSLGLTVLIMLLINPLYVFDLGFQLSVLATSGLLFLQPLFLPRCHLVKQPRCHLGWLFSIPLFGESLSTTVSAQLAVTPLIFYNFGTVSLLSPIVNGIILWIIPIVMILGSMMAILGLVLEPLARVLGYLTYGFLWYFSEVVIWFDRFNWGQLLVEKPSVFLVIGYYFILTGVILRGKILNRN